MECRSDILTIKGAPTSALPGVTIENSSLCFHFLHDQMNLN